MLSSCTKRFGMHDWISSWKEILLTLRLFWEDLLKNLDLKEKGCFLCLLTLKIVSIAYQVKLFDLLWGKVCSKILDKWCCVTATRFQNYCFSRRKIIRFFLCKSWCILRFRFNSIDITHCNGCFGRRYERWFIDRIVKW